MMIKSKSKSKVHPNKKLRAKAGDVFGSLRIVRKMRNPKGVYGICWKVQCSCGSESFVIREQYLFRKDNPKRDCGCKRRTIITEYPREYCIWKMMNRRCYYDTHTSYEYYGGSGITVHDDWRDGGADVPLASNLKAFGKFLRHVGKAPSAQHTLDRRDPFEGYTYGNVRWATPKEQANNKRVHHLAKMQRAATISRQIKSGEGR